MLASLAPSMNLCSLEQVVGMGINQISLYLTSFSHLLYFHSTSAVPTTLTLKWNRNLENFLNIACWPQHCCWVYINIFPGEALSNFKVDKLLPMETNWFEESLSHFIGAMPNWYYGKGVYRLYWRGRIRGWKNSAGNSEKKPKMRKRFACGREHSLVTLLVMHALMSFTS